MRCIVALLVLGTAHGLHGQRPTGPAALEGTVMHSVAGQAISRAVVCVSLPVERTHYPRCGAIDQSSGRYRVDSLPEGRWRVGVNCATMNIFAHSMASDSIAFKDSAAVRRDWMVTTDGCDPRPLRRIPGTFRGYWTPGFESSEFIPCAADAWFLPGDSLRTRNYDERRAWAVLRRGSVPEGFVWPKGRRDRYGNPRYYVEWRGEVVGPGHYGHMGVSAFEINVDSVLTVRAPRRGDCRPAP
jgi:hypothetical protein